MKATHNVKAYRNSMDSTSGKAPFLGTYISHENVPLTALCEQVAAQSGLTAIQVRAIIEGSFDAIAALEKEGLVIVHLDGMSVWAVITGSFPTGDAAFDPERNALNLAIRLDDSLRLALVNATAQLVTDADLTKVRLDNIKDVEVERPVNLIHGQHIFRAAGWNLVLGDAGARVCLKDRNGVEHEVIVDEQHSNQLFTAHTAELLEGGDYTLWVESRGGDAEGPLQRGKCKVKYLRVEPPVPPVPAPTIDSAGTQGFEPGTIEAPGGVVEVSGSNLETATAIDLLVGEDGTPVEDMELWQSLSATYDEDGGVLTTNDGVEGSAPQGYGAVRVTTAGGSASYPVQYSVH